MDLDDAYANGAYIAGASDFPDMWAQKAAAFRERCRCEIGVPYGPDVRDVFDVFLPDTSAVGVMVFVHGGYWRAFDRSSWSHLAAGAVARGWSVVIPSYRLAPDARIGEITQQIAVVIQKVAARFVEPIVLAGHSAGGHLVARMVCKGVLPDQVAHRIQKVVPISPLSDLRPLLRTAMNDDLRLSSDEAIAESPVLARPLSELPVTAWVGGDERPAFLDQARWLAEAWDCGHVIAPGRHHFDVIADLEETDSALMQELLG